MADGLVLNAGSGGSTLATDDAGASGHVQVVKLAIATDGSAVLIPADATLGLRVTLTAQGGVDLMDCTVNNGAGAASIPVQGAVAADGVAAQNPVLVGGYASTAQPSSMSADGDVVPLWLTRKGALVTEHGRTVKTVTGSTSTTATVVSAVAAKRIKVIAYSLMMVGATAVTVTFKDGAGGSGVWTVGPLQTAASTNSGANLSVAAPSFLFATSAGVLLELAVSAAVTVTYSIAYFDDDAV